MKWLVQILLPDGQTWFTLATCDSPESVGAIITALCGASHGCPHLVRVEKVSVIG